MGSLTLSILCNLLKQVHLILHDLVLVHLLLSQDITMGLKSLYTVYELINHVIEICRRLLYRDFIVTVVCMAKNPKISVITWLIWIS